MKITITVDAPMAADASVDAVVACHVAVSASEGQAANHAPRVASHCPAGMP
jgi:hypothetical protein